MFDSFVFEDGVLPDNKVPAGFEFQTKDLNCCLDIYKVDSLGYIKKYSCHEYGETLPLEENFNINTTISVYSNELEYDNTIDIRNRKCIGNKNQEYSLQIIGNKVVSAVKVSEFGYEKPEENKMNMFLKAVLIIFALLYCSVSYAELDPVAIGVETQNQNNYLLIHDFNEFNLLKPDNLGLNRYGFGRGQFQIGNESQIYGESRSGVLLGSGLVKVGVEALSGKLSYHDTILYQWNPALALGIGDHNKDFGYFIGARAGLSYASDGNGDFTGSVASLQYKTYQASYILNNYIATGNTQEIADFVINNKYNFQYQSTNQNGITYMVGLKMER